MSKSTSHSHQYLADKPVATSAQDEFSRYAFAKRIAETIRDRKSPESLVIGLYGRWGEGKSSVLNFIATELKSASTITMTFNPWRFEGEDQLLMGFFAELAGALNQRLKTTGEQAGELISQYAEAIIPKFQFFGGAVTTEPGAQLKKIGDLLATTSLQDLKKRLEGLLRTNRKRVVIIIDDIDRLNKQEIQALFRLVKLTGDFNFVTYLLSFDDKMVARALGEMYEGGDEASGRSFLEKIIQVPLHLPLVQPEVMLRFFLDQINIVLRSTQVSISQEDSDRFARAAQASILPMITVPRHAIRYCNTLNFILPLLRGETNTADVMLIVALKQFYPHIHDLIAGMSHAVTGIHRDTAVNKHVQSQLDPILASDSASIGFSRTLLYALFPMVQAVYNTSGRSLFSSRRFRNEAEMDANKSIASAHYFKRYFSYAVQPGEIADSQFSEFIDTLTNSDDHAIYNSTLGLLKDAKMGEVLRRTSQVAPNLSTSAAVKFCAVIGRLSDQLSFDMSPIGWRFGDGNTAIQLIFDLLSLQEPDNRLIIASSLISESTSFQFGQTFVHELREVTKPYEQTDYVTRNITKKPALITSEQYKVLAQLLIDRALVEAGDEAVYNCAAIDAEDLLLVVWPEVSPIEDIQYYIHTRLSRNPAELLLLLRALSSKVSSNGSAFLPAHISPEKFQTIREILDAQYLFEVGIWVLKGEPIKLSKEQSKRNMTDKDRLHQFMHYYEQALNGENPSEGDSGAELV